MVRERKEQDIPDISCKFISEPAGADLEFEPEHTLFRIVNVSEDTIAILCSGILLALFYYPEIVENYG